MKNMMKTMGFRFQMIGITFAMGFGSVSCSKVEFNTPLPEVSVQEKEFPQSLLGSYSSKRNPSESMVVQKNRVIHYQLKTVVFVKGKRNEGLTLNGNTIKEEGNDLAYAAFPMGDSLLGVQTKVDTSVVLGDKDQLRTMDNWFFINKKIKDDQGQVKWRVFLAKKEGEDLSLFGITEDDRVALLEKTAKIKIEGGSVVKGNISNEELKKFIALGGFSKLEEYTQKR